MVIGMPCSGKERSSPPLKCGTTAPNQPGEKAHRAGEKAHRTGIRALGRRTLQKVVRGSAWTQILLMQNLQKERARTKEAKERRAMESPRRSHPHGRAVGLRRHPRATRTIARISTSGTTALPPSANAAIIALSNPKIGSATAENTGPKTAPITELQTQKRRGSCLLLTGRRPKQAPHAGFPREPQAPTRKRRKHLCRSFLHLFKTKPQASQNLPSKDHQDPGRSYFLSQLRIFRSPSQT